MRSEFPASVRKAAVRRANGKCEAAGPVYGLEQGQVCGASLAYGIEIDHYPIPATDPDCTGLENAVVCCKKCHRWKTSNYDVPMQAKGRRIKEKHRGAAKPSSFPGSRNSRFKRTIDGRVIDRRTGEEI
jgi:5-methylcytosine-specific restriction protein A